MTIIEWLQFALIVLLLLIPLYYSSLRSYFREKGKNLATKEDVQEITSLVETVKYQLQFSLQAKLSLRAEEHQSLVDYFTKYSAWLSAIMSWTASEVGRDNASKLHEMRSHLEMLQRDFEAAAGRMKLFVENDQILSQHGELEIETFKLQGDVERMTFQLELILLQVKGIELKTPLDQQIGEYAKILEQQRGLFERFIENRLEKYKNLLPIVNKQTSAISRHIKSLADG